MLFALGQTIAFCEVKMLCLKANLLGAKACFPKDNLLLAKALLQKAALLDWSAPGLRERNSGEWRKLHNAELYALHFSPDIIRKLKST